MRIVFAAILMLFCLPVFSEAKPNLHPSVLDSAALVVIDTGSFGSGVYVHTDKFSYLITAKHVLYDEKKGSLEVIIFLLLIIMSFTLI